MDRYSVKQPAGWLLAGVAVLVLFGTTRGRFGADPPLAGLISYFGIAFVVAFFCVQIGLCLWFRTTIGFAWIAGAFVIGLAAGSIFESVWHRPSLNETNPAMAEVLKDHNIDTPDYDWSRHKLVTGVCVSAIALGMGLATNKL